MSRFDSVGIAKQVGMGTKQTVMEYFVPVESADEGTNQEQLEKEETIGTPFPTDLERGTKFWTPSAAGAVRVASAPRWLSAFWGAPTTTTPGDAPTARNHAFNPAVNTVPVPHSILDNRTDPDVAITDLFWDAIGNELSLSIEPDGFLDFEANFVARDNDDARPEPVVTADLTRRFPFHEVKTYVSIDGGGETEVKSSGWTMNYSNGIDTDQKVLGSRLLYKLAAGNRSAEFGLTVKQDLATWYRRALADSPNNVKLRMEALGPVIAGATRYKFEVIGYRLHVVDAPAGIDASDTLADVELTLRGAYDSGVSKFVEANIINLVAAGY